MGLACINNKKSISVIKQKLSHLTYNIKCIKYLSRKYPRITVKYHRNGALLALEYCYLFILIGCVTQN